MAVKITKKERKRNAGPNAQTLKSMRCPNVIQFSDGSTYRGQDIRLMDMRAQGLGFQKMGSGVPYVKISNGS